MRVCVRACVCGVCVWVVLTHLICVDIDECTRGTHECSQTCNNAVGSYTCQCGPGYRLAADGRNCDGLFVCCAGATVRN